MLLDCERGAFGTRPPPILARRRRRPITATGLLTDAGLEREMAERMAGLFSEPG
jgi:hypothetical protein